MHGIGIYEDIKIIKERLQENIYLDLGKSTEDLALEELQEDGSFRDIEYEEQSRAEWQPAVHMNRVKLLAAAYKSISHQLYGSSLVRNKILSALNYWVEKDYICSNWWFNEIYIPSRLADVLLLLGQEIPRQLQIEILALIKRGDYKEHWTGQNLIWGVSTMLKRSCIEEDKALIAKVINRTLKEICIAEDGKEGIQADYSFHQHGDILYSGGYGRSFTMDSINLANLVRGTKFMFEEDKLAVLVNYILDGQQWFNYKNVFDYSTTGREITREESDSRVWLSEVCNKLLEIEDVPRRQELQLFANRLLGKERQLCGNRYFWKSDMMVHHRENYYTSLKMVSERTLGTESGNGEGLKSFHISEGCTFILRTGNEYYRIFPLWDWRRIPGTTIEQKEGELPLVEWGKGSRGQSKNVGGVSDGKYGCAAMELKQGELKAKKAWFYFDKEFIALGAGITCESDYPVYTSINQCHLQSAVAVNAAGATSILDKGEHRINNLHWAHHAGIGYVFPESCSIKVRNDLQSGSWTDINKSSSSEPVIADVFSIWIDHGKKLKDMKYAYIVVPEIETEEMEAYYAELPVNILRNNAGLQAVWHNGLNMLQAMFWEPGEITLPNGLTVKVDKPCSMMLQPDNGLLKITAANPENRELEVNVSVFNGSCEEKR